MRLRRLGRSGIEVSECTLGTAMLTATGSNPAEARATVALALDSGINAIEIDAGDHDSAALLSHILKGDGVHVFARVTSLVPFDLPSPHVPAQEAYPGHHIRAETEGLLARLGIERLGIVQLPAWCPEWLEEGDWRETLERLRDEGKIAGFGVSLFDHDVDAGFEAVASGTIDTVQVMLNVFDQGATAALLPLCGQHDVGVIARSPLYYGALAVGGVRDFPPDDWRSRYFYDDHARETAERVGRLAREVAPPDGSIADMALRFCLTHPAVSTVAVGMRTRRQLEANLAAFDRGPLGADALATLAHHAWLC